MVVVNGGGRRIVVLIGECDDVVRWPMTYGAFFLEERALLPCESRSYLSEKGCTRPFTL